ncbi:hypothetical protein ACFU99_13745, partial [Streptomyces sp. NPDC057654]
MDRVIAVEEHIATEAFLRTAHRLDVLAGDRAEIGLMRTTTLPRSWPGAGSRDADGRGLPDAVSPMVPVRRAPRILWCRTRLSYA